MKISGTKGTAWIASGFPHSLGITLFFKPKGEVSFRQIERIESSFKTHKSDFTVLINKANKIISD